MRRATPSPTASGGDIKTKRRPEKSDAGMRWTAATLRISDAGPINIFFEKVKVGTQQDTKRCYDDSVDDKAEVGHNVASYFLS